MTWTCGAEAAAEGEASAAAPAKSPKPLAKRQRNPKQAQGTRVQLYIPCLHFCRNDQLHQRPCPS